MRQNAANPPLHCNMNPLRAKTAQQYHGAVTAVLCPDSDECVLGGEHLPSIAQKWETKRKRAKPPDVLDKPHRMRDWLQHREVH
jgi:hypothetical protein